jgi:uncharacterized membrane protein
MKAKNIGYVLFFLILVAIAIQMIHYYPLLPERVASHFDIQGQPNGWSSKTLFAGLYAVLVLVMSFIFLLLPRLVVKLPAFMVNIPNRTYWLAPERKAATADKLAGYMIWMGCGILLFVFSIFQLVIQANLTPEAARLGDGVWVLFGLFITCVVVWCIALLIGFRKPVEN